jgi:hypothetical protein
MENKAVLEGTALFEFGVYRGTSMMMWHDIYSRHNLNHQFVGFDSFRGLPKETVDKNSFWYEGEFNANGVINPALNTQGIRLVVGFYDTTLNDDTAKSFNGVKVGLVHIDCDTYSSTKTVWEWLLKHDLLAPNAVIIYDDWGAWRQAKCDEYDIGEAKAHKEIEEKYGIKFVDFRTYIVDPAFYEVKVYIYEGCR